MAFGAVGSASWFWRFCSYDINSYGSVAVSVGDLIVATFSEVSGSSTATVATDNLGGSYTQIGIALGKYWYRYVTAPGTLTTISFTCTASANDYAIVAGVFEGPFTSTPLDRNPGSLSDTTTPFTSQASTVLSQADELIVGAIGLVRGQTDTTATAPMSLVLNRASGTDNASNTCSVALGAYVVSATTSVSISFAATGTITSGFVNIATFRRGGGALTFTRYVDPDTFPTGSSVDRGPVGLSQTRYVDPDVFGAADVQAPFPGQSLTQTRYPDPDVFGVPAVGRGPRNLQQARYADPDTFNPNTSIGRGPVGLTQARHVDADAFGIAIVRAFTSLTTTRYADPDTFGADTIGRGPVGLLQTRYVDPDTFKAHTVGRGSIGVLQTRYTDLDLFGTPSVVLGPPPGAALTAIRYVDPDTFNTHIIGRGPVGLIQTRYADPDTFKAHTVNRGPVGLLQVRYVDPDLFGAANLILGPPPNKFLTTTRFADPDTFKAHTVGRGLVNLTQTRYIDPDAFKTAIVGRGSVGLVQTRYVDVDEFYTYTVTIEIWYLNPARYVNATIFRNHTVIVDLTQDLYANIFHNYSYSGGKGFVGIRSPISILGSQYAVHIGA